LLLFTAKPADLQREVERKKAWQQQQQQSSDERLTEN
jgi:hypothetical protein